MSRSRLAFVDWLKVFGMLMIVYGHASGGTQYFVTAPVESKQLGVAFFVFATAICLPRERRPSWQVVVSRVVPIYVVGLLFAVLMTGIGWVRSGDLTESNYPPFMLGLNVLVNFFPANPTTWYIGTYLHLLVIWGIWLRHVEIRPAVMIGICVVCQLVRAALMTYAGNYIAYMSIANWLTVMSLGLWAGQNGMYERWSARQIIVAATLLLGLYVSWSRVVAQFDVTKGFPFQRFQLGGVAATAIFTSIVIECIYSISTWLVFRIALALPDSAVVRFFARNTLVIFIVHMPLIYECVPWVKQHTEPGIVRVMLNMFIYFVIPALFGEGLLRAINTKWLADEAVRRAAEWIPRLPAPRIVSVAEK